MHTFQYIRIYMYMKTMVFKDFKYLAYAALSDSFVCLFLGFFNLFFKPDALVSM